MSNKPGPVQIRLQDVKSEWRAQIERCLELGIQPHFLNSHEHIHMLPPLYSITRQLARLYGIRHVRHVAPERVGISQGVVRNSIIAVLSHLKERRAARVSPRFLGLGVSGKLNTKYLQRRFRSLIGGEIYELMCHPGYYDPQEIEEPRLLAYHDWESEFRSLTDESFRSLLARHNIKLIGYRDLTVGNSRLTVREAAADDA